MQITSRDIYNSLILYPNLTFLAFKAYLLEPPTQEYITKRKSIKNLNIKKCDKNYRTHSRIRIVTNKSRI